MKTIGIIIFDDAEELDFVGPYEVFQMINEVANRMEQSNLVDVKLISETGNDITGIKGMRVGAHASIQQIHRLDILCVPGGQGSRSVIKNPNLLSWVKNISNDCEWITSVCTGAFVLAKAGLTKDKNITTHWAAFDEFKQLGLEGNLNAGVRYIQDGNLVTSAGVSAGIDMALWLTGQLFSPGFARAVQLAMEYDPAPPYTDEI